MNNKQTCTDGRCGTTKCSCDELDKIDGQQFSESVSDESLRNLVDHVGRQAWEERFEEKYRQDYFKWERNNECCEINGVALRKFISQELAQAKREVAQGVLALADFYGNENGTYSQAVRWSQVEEFLEKYLQDNPINNGDANTV